MATPLYDGKTTASGHLSQMIPVVPGSIVSKPLLDTGSLKQVLFAMDKGQEVSSHRAPFLATLHILEGQLAVQVGKESFNLSAGQWVLMPADIPHQLQALAGSCQFLLTMVKG